MTRGMRRRIGWLLLVLWERDRCGFKTVEFAGLGGDGYEIRCRYGWDSVNMLSLFSLAFAGFRYTQV